MLFGETKTPDFDDRSNPCNTLGTSSGSNISVIEPSCKQIKIPDLRSYDKTGFFLWRATFGNWNGIISVYL